MPQVRRIRTHKLYTYCYNAFRFVYEKALLLIELYKNTFLFQVRRIRTRKLSTNCFNLVDIDWIDWSTKMRISSLKNCSKSWILSWYSVSHSVNGWCQKNLGFECYKIWRQEANSSTILSPTFYLLNSRLLLDRDLFIGASQAMKDGKAERRIAETRMQVNPGMKPEPYPLKAMISIWWDWESVIFMKFLRTNTL